MAVAFTVPVVVADADPVLEPEEDAEVIAEHQLVYIASQLF